MQYPKYPDIGTIEKAFKEETRKAFDLSESGSGAIYIRPVTFLQTWPNTAGGFSEPGYMSGQAISRQFTSVARAYVCGRGGFAAGKICICSVFFGEKLAYTVTNPCETFYQDLKEKRMKSVGDAKRSYKNITVAEYKKDTDD